MDLLILWLVAAAAVAGIAGLKHRTVWKWFFYGFMIWPVALIHVLLTGINKPCPHCATNIPRAAKICPNCRSELAARPVAGSERA
ncbi:hypothetical protein [Oceanibaculum indicum]|uniref:Uncharacterized protein n=1 Tax=Oceanibaculum indicum P24 TaxID=1207063 RepID=K2J1P2_9PROT|nr:hypothetical protein [Oceanibaculum indicum]EKE68717.1 hypothetical protein P24_17287 [Oceanibaculum indicum P24]